MFIAAWTQCKKITFVNAFIKYSQFQVMSCVNFELFCNLFQGCEAFVSIFRTL